MDARECLGKAILSDICPRRAFPLGCSSHVVVILCLTNNDHNKLAESTICTLLPFVDSCTQEGATALHWACQKGHRDIVSLLWTCGADATAVTKVCSMYCHVIMCGHLLKNCPYLVMDKQVLYVSHLYALSGA